MTTLTRRYHFSASHRLHSSVLTEAENARLYGKCNNPFGHGHDYFLEITVTGPIDPQSGLIVPVHRLDRFVSEVILSRFAHRNVNLDVPQLAGLVPTTENIVLVIARLLRQNWMTLNWLGLRLLRVHLQETDRNGFELMLETREVSSPLACQAESVTTNV